MKPVKQYNLRDCSVGITDGKNLWCAPLEMSSIGVILMPILMTTNLGIQAILRFLSQQFERLQCWYYWFDGFIKYAVEMVSDSMI
jgi:hypothetical protein